MVHRTAVVGAVMALICAAGPLPAEVPAPYTTPPEFLDLYFDFTGAGDPDFPAGKTSIAQRLIQSEAALAGDAETAGPLVLVTGSQLLIYDTNRKLHYQTSFRASRDSGFFELTAVSHIGPAIAYLARLKENNDPAWPAAMKDLLRHIQAARQLNLARENHWLDQANIAPWEQHKSQIRNLVGYALAMAEDYLQGVAAGHVQFSLSDVQQHFLEGNPQYPISYNTVMIGTFMLTALQEMATIHDAIQPLKLDWEHAMVIVRSEAGTNVTAGLTAETNWMVPFVSALSHGKLDPSRLLIAPYAKELDTLGQDPLPTQAYQYYTQAVWGSIHGRTRIAGQLFSQWETLSPTARQPIAGDYAVTKADDIAAFTARLKLSMADPREMLSNSVGFWLAGELQAKEWDLSQVEIPGVTSGFPSGTSGYPDLVGQ